MAQGKPRKTGEFFVYLYKRPDGSVFYVGKGTKRRAQSVSPSRRNRKFMNILNKYGAKDVLLELIPCVSEEAAFDLEVATIKRLREGGADLANFTDGGEGCSNRKPTEKALAALAAWQGAYHRLSDESKERICEGLAVGRKKSVAWRKSEAGQAHLKKLAKIGKEALHRERTATCIECGCEFSTKSAKARACSRLCEQRNRRRRQAEERHGA